MSYRVPVSSEEYSRDEDQRARSALQTQIEDVDRVTKRLQTPDGTISLGDGTMTLANGTNNNVAAGFDTYMQVSGPTAAFTITGIVPVFASSASKAVRGAKGRMLVLRNPTAYTMTIAHQSGSSTASNRIITSSAANVEMGAGTTAILVYNVASERWHLVDSVALNLVLTTLTVSNTGLRLLDTDASHYLTVKAGSDLTANRTFTLTTGDANRTLTLTADSSIGGTAYVSGGTDVAIADGGTGASTAADAFANLKQAATEAATGVIEKATTAEASAGTDTDRAVTPAGLQQAIDDRLTDVIATNTTTSGSSTTFTIGADYDELVFVVTTAFSVASAASTPYLQMELSDDGGSTYSTVAKISDTFTSASHTCLGAFRIYGGAESGVSKVWEGNLTVGGSTVCYSGMEATETGKITHVRLSLSASTFDAGAITCIGRGKRV